MCLSVATGCSQLVLAPRLPPSRQPLFRLRQMSRVPAARLQTLTCVCPPVQFGPNCTTFLLAGELYPTDVRTTAHGTSAGVAKLGALWVSLRTSVVLQDRCVGYASTTVGRSWAVAVSCFPLPLLHTLHCTRCTLC